MNQLPPLSSSDHNIIDFIILLPLELTRAHCSDSDSIPHDYFNSLPNSIKVCPGKAAANHKFYPKPIRILLNRKLAIWKKLKANRTNITLKQKYVAISKNCRIAMHEYYVNKENWLLESDNIGRFYKYVNRNFRLNQVLEF